mmetsp:Transcript_105598/g.297098  ORF Transcript_105598/g.297098 Transcript_105598/m.297098 type:complete len:234 (-) Transcript_105598:101-802(-)
MMGSFVLFFVCAFLTRAVANAGGLRASGKLDVKGVAYATQPWDADVTLGLDASSPQESGTFQIRVHPDWAPEAAKRFQDLVQSGTLNDARFFRVVPGFMAQFGIPADPEVAKEWRAKPIKDDKPNQSNKRGTITFAMAGPGTRTTQLFINFKDNSFLDSQNFPPFAEVLGEGMEAVDKIQSRYREKPDQASIQRQGNSYLDAKFPKLSFVKSIVPAGDAFGAAASFTVDAEGL